MSDGRDRPRNGSPNDRFRIPSDALGPRRRPAPPPRQADRPGPDRARGRVDAGRAAAVGRCPAGLGLHLARGALGLAGRGAAAALGAHGECGRGPPDVSGTGRGRHRGDQRPGCLRPADRRVRRRAGPGDGQGPAPDVGPPAGADLAAPRVAAGRRRRARASSGPGPSGGRSSPPSRRSASPRRSSGAPRVPVSMAPRSWTG